MTKEAFRKLIIKSILISVASTLIVMLLTSFALDYKKKLLFEYRLELIEIRQKDSITYDDFIEYQEDQRELTRAYQEFNTKEVARIHKDMDWIKNKLTTSRSINMDELTSK